MADYPIDVVQIEVGNPPNGDIWGEYLIKMLREFAKDMSRHDNKIENQILNALYDMIQNSQDFLNRGINAAAMLAYDAKQAINEMNNRLNELLDGGVGNISNQLNGVSDRISQLENTINSNYYYLGVLTNVSARDTVDAITGRVKSLESNVKSNILESTNNLTNTLNTIDSGLKNEILNSTGSVQRYISDANYATKSYINTAQSNIKNYIDSSETSVNNAIANLTTTTNAIGGDFKNALEYFWGLVKQWLEENIAYDSNKLKNDITNIMHLQSTVAKQIQG